PHERLQPAVEPAELDHHHPIDDGDERVGMQRVALEREPRRVRRLGDLEGLDGLDPRPCREALVELPAGTAHGDEPVPAGPAAVEAVDLGHGAQCGLPVRCGHPRSPFPSLPSSCSARVSYSARVSDPRTAASWSGTIRRIAASRIRWGSSATRRASGPMYAGTVTSNRGRTIARTTAAATSAGCSSDAAPEAVPTASSVSTTPGITAVSSTPLPRSSSRTPVR